MAAEAVEVPDEEIEFLRFLPLGEISVFDSSTFSSSNLEGTSQLLALSNKYGYVLALSPTKGNKTIRINNSIASLELFYSATDTLIKLTEADEKPALLTRPIANCEAPSIKSVELSCDELGVALLSSDSVYIYDVRDVAVAFARVCNHFLIIVLCFVLCVLCLFAHLIACTRE